MGTLNQKIAYLDETKNLIKTAIINRGVDVTNELPFSQYPSKLDQIEVGTPWTQEYYDGVLAEAANYRKAGWLSLTDNTDQKVEILNAVFNDDSNAVVFLATTSTGQYQVDWGDGNIELFNSNVKAEHVYNYSNVNLNSDSLALGYKQCIIKITPVSGNILTLNFQQSSTLLGNSTTYKSISTFLDMYINCPELTSLVLYASSAYWFHTNLLGVKLKANKITSMANQFSGLHALEYADILTDATLLTNTSSMFSSCFALKTVKLFDTQNVTTMNSMFRDCYSLTTVPLFNTIKVTDMSYMFYNCRSLTTVPLFDTQNVTNMSYMFQNCYSLTTVPLFNTIKVTDMSYMFQYCASLVAVPLFNTRSLNIMNNMFQYCSSLVTVPLFNTKFVYNMSYMFQGCASLVTVPLFDTMSTSDMSNMFQNCYSLTTVPLFNTQNVTNMSYMFRYCYSLTTFPLFNTQNVTNMSYMFDGCSSLTEVPLLNTYSATNIISMFSGCTGLKYINNFNFKRNLTSSDILGANNSVTKCDARFGSTVTLANNKLSSSALSNVMDKLYPVSTAQTLTLTGNFGVDTAFTKTGLTLTAGSNIVNIADTSSIVVGQPVINSNLSYNADINVTVDSVNNKITKSGHLIADQTPLIIKSDLTWNNWSQYSMPSASNWWAIEYGNGIFLAASQYDNRKMAYSTNGRDWYASTTPVLRSIMGIVFGDGKFVLLSYGSDSTLYTNDGVGYVHTTLPYSLNWSGLAYGNGKFVMVAQGSTSAAYCNSSDMIWHEITLPDVYYSNIAYGNGKFVVVGQNGSIAYSTDAITWHKVVSPVPGAYISTITYGNGKFIAVTGNFSDEGTDILISEDGINWSLSKRNFNSAGVPVIKYLNNRFFIIGNGVIASGSYASAVVEDSEDGINWSYSNLPSTGLWSNITYGNGKLVAIKPNNTSAYMDYNKLVDIRLVDNTLYTRNTTSNDFQVSDSKDGALLTLPNISSANIRVGSYVTSINPNTSITLSSPVTTTASSQTLTFRPAVDVMKALIKNWSVTF